jgi:hypothetical protein
MIRIALVATDRDLNAGPHEKAIEKALMPAVEEIRMDEPRQRAVMLVAFEPRREDEV